MIVGKMDDALPVKLHDLRCFDAVARHGSFQAAADALHRTHPSVFAAVARLEAALGLTLLDRSGYRVTLTEHGRLFHGRAAVSLREMANLGAYARQISAGEETVLHVVLGDLCPRPPILEALSTFFSEKQRTRLHLDYEAVTGPFERLRDGTADLIFHRADDLRANLEQIKLCEVELLPVAAPGFLPFDASVDLTPSDLRPFTQCVIRDTAKRTSSEDFFLIEGAPYCSVPDHAMKKELILHRMAWGHLPDFIAEQELRAGTLISLRGHHLRGRIERLAAMRRADRPHGPIAEQLWQWLKRDEVGDQIRHTAHNAMRPAQLPTVPNAIWLAHEALTIT